MCDNNIRDDFECYLLKSVVSFIEAVKEELKVVNREILQLLADERKGGLYTYFAKQGCETETDDTSLSNHGIV